MPYHPALHRIWKVSLIGVTVHILVCLLLRFGQTRLIFHPSAQVSETPAVAGLAYENVELPMPVGQIHGWWIPSATISSSVLLYLHGNGSNLGDLIDRAWHWHQIDLSLLLIDYRGYGHSQGNFPREASVYEDAEAAWRYLTRVRRIAPAQIIIYGQSLGGAVAIDLASKHPDAAAVIVESSFTSMRAMVMRWWLNYLLPVDWLLTEQFDSLSKIRSLKVPILLIHGTADRLIPASMSQTLYAAAPEPKQLVLIPNANHDTVAQYGGKRYWQSVQEFLHRLKPAVLAVGDSTRVGV